MRHTFKKLRGGQVVSMDYVNTAMERLEKNDVHYRFSIDVQGSLLHPSA